MKRRKTAARSVFLRYIVTNLLILLPPFLVTTAYFAVSSAALSRAADAVAEVQLSSSVSYVDRKLSDLEKIVAQLVVDYRVNRYLNTSRELDPVEVYDKKLIADKLSSLVLAGEFVNRCMLYLGADDSIIYESGFADFSGFYGTLLSVEGWDEDGFRNLITGGETGVLSEYAGFRASTGGRLMPAHFLIRPIGYQGRRRGSFVAMIDAAELGRRLSKLPDLYGGFMLVFDKAGTLLASSPPDPSPELIAAAVSEETGSAATIGEERYRLYRVASSVNGWSYAALINENRITASARRTRDIAFLLLGTGFLIALAVSYGVASSNSKPIARLFSLVLQTQDMETKRAGSAYARVEEAIRNLADSKLRLEQEVDSVHVIARTYFFHSLLRGEYRERPLFEEDRSRFAVLQSPGYYYVIEGRLPPLAAALEGKDHLALSEALRDAFASCLGPDEYALILFSGAVAVIKRAAEPSAYMEETSDFIHRISLGGAVREGLIFGVGTPVADPFLLTLSYGEAETASGTTNPGSALRFYEALPAPADVYRYPLEIESAVIKAVLSANLVLLESLIGGIHAENFIDRTLPHQEARYLISALRGTALRLSVEFERTGRSVQVCEALKDLGSSASQEDFHAVAAILFSMAEEIRRGKRSHNESLAAEVREYVNRRFRDFSLSLTSIAEAFKLSESYLSSFFKEQAGECLSEYIQRKRMTEAAGLLRESREPVDTVASGCGYANDASFRRAFKRFYGISPSEYRDREGHKVQEERL